ncbi:Uu.00g043510.m01.CDS01 [Anthostomella pinea]|uniref:Eukaryotic translation initiation factor 3 subunit M n=1 Tax=Anthostomella pinea TaxID=933095 RepID=A0AAI8YEC8_9PEZI|nr:Uu.00g043510.m01.CDS01 [Anthostomella pinea]
MSISASAPPGPGAPAQDQSQNFQFEDSYEGPDTFLETTPSLVFDNSEENTDEGNVPTDERVRKVLQHTKRKLQEFQHERRRTGIMAHQSQLVFVDGTFAELAQEMADYLNTGEGVKPLLEKEQNDEVLKKIIIASTALNAVPEKEFTAAYNLLVYLVLQSKNAEMFLPRVCDNLMKPITSSPVNGPGLALNALTNIFNMLPPDNELRFNVFMAILKFLKMHSMFENLKPYLSNLEAWMKEWEIDDDDQRQLYETVAETAHEAGEETMAYQFVVKALRTFEDDDVKSEDAQRLSLRALKSAILSPTHFDFQELLAVPSVQALSDTHPVYFELLTICAEKDLEDYNQFKDEHEGFIEKEHLDDEKLQTKMRLLTFTSLAARTTTREIPYDEIAKALQIPDSKVELWAIDVIRSGQVEGRMSQQKRVFLVHRTTYRVFGEKQWRQLGDIIDSWKESVNNVITMLRKEQANVEAQKKRDQEEIERKMANVGFGSGPSGGRRGGDRGGDRGDRGDRNDRAPRKERTDDDD